jgi:hypothetical protein
MGSDEPTQPTEPLLVPHDKSYVIGSEALLHIARRDELGLAPDQQPLATVVLYALPDPKLLATWPAGEMLLRYWRLLFHTRVHQAIGQRRADGLLDEATVHERMARIGATECAEARSVLHQERFLLPPESTASLFEEFAARYLELRPGSCYPSPCRRSSPRCRMC